MARGGTLKSHLLLYTPSISCVSNRGYAVDFQTAYAMMCEGIWMNAVDGDRTPINNGSYRLLNGTWEDAFSGPSCDNGCSGFHPDTIALRWEINKGLNELAKSKGEPHMVLVQQ